MQIGAIIEKGPMDWQIIQQVEGKADISLTGNWASTEELKSPRVYVRVVNEDSGDRVISWQPSEDLGNGKWQIIIKGVPAGGLYRIETCLNQEDVRVMEWSIRGDMIHHVGVGDLYVIAGQSNSAGYGKDPVYDPSEIGIHIFKNAGKWDLASHPLNESTNTLHVENRENGNPGHSPYLNFAKQLKRVLGYPIGLIQAALGGSPLSSWNPEEDGILYRNMMNIIEATGQNIKGVLWYQGCSEAGEGVCDTYLHRFKSMVEHMREDMKNKDLPVFTVQLNRYVVPSTEAGNRYWGKVKEAQRQAAKQIPNVFIIPANDCTLSDLIHNSSASNMVLGERLAKIALNKIYGKNILCDAPDIIKAEKVGDDKVILTFDHVNNRLYAFDMGGDQLPFTIEDEKGYIQIRSYELSGISSFLLTMDRNLEGTCQIHGAFEQNPKAIIPVDFETHLPMLSFYGMEIL